MKTTLLIMFFLIGLMPSMAQNYFLGSGEYQLICNYLPQISGDNRYLILYCKSNEFVQFTFISGQYYDVEIHYSGKTEQKGLVNEFQLMGSLYSSEVLILANKKDTVAFIIFSELPTVELDSIRVNYSGINSEMVGDTLLLCDFPDDNKLVVSFEIYTNSCKWGASGMLNYWALNTYKNGEVSSLKGSELKDGDTLWVTMYDAISKPDYFFCGCLNLSGPKTSKKVIVRKRSIDNYKVEEPIVDICPGDTITLEAGDVVFTEWKYKVNGSSTWYNSSTKNLEINYPVQITGKVYKDSRSQCWANIDTVNYQAGVNCTTSVISGFVFNDKDANGIKGINESNIQNAIIEILPGPIYLYTADGNFTTELPSGQKYKVIFSDEGWQSDTIEVDFSNVNNFNVNKNVFLATSTKRENDLQINISSLRMRPGFQTSYYIDVRNNGSTNLNAVQVEALIDTLISDISYSSTPSFIENGIIRWTVNIPAQTTTRYTISGLIPADVKLLGKEVVSYVNVNHALDTYTSNNADTIQTIITGSYDPNDKQVFSEKGKRSIYVTDSTRLEYLIRFQNTGTDTAFTVKVVDTLSSLHDLKTLKVIAASHKYTFEVKDNVLIWTFNNILLPDSNVNEPLSHGFVKFSVKAAKGSPLFTEINNKAYIYFDYNPPVITNETSVTIGKDKTTTVEKAETFAEKILVYPNPVKDGFYVEADLKGILKLLDMTGVIRSEQQFENKAYLRTDKLNPGCYLIKLESKERVYINKVNIGLDY